LERNDRLTLDRVDFAIVVNAKAVDVGCCVAGTQPLTTYMQSFFISMSWELCGYELFAAGRWTRNTRRLSAYKIQNNGTGMKRH
jgi:hypothetical protein